MEVPIRPVQPVVPPQMVRLPIRHTLFFFPAKHAVIHQSSSPAETCQQKWNTAENPSANPSQLHIYLKVLESGILDTMECCGMFWPWGRTGRVVDFNGNFHIRYSRGTVIPPQLQVPPPLRIDAYAQYNSLSRASSVG